MWFMGLDKNNIPNGWDKEPWGNAIEVEDAVYDLASIHTDWYWDGTDLLAPPITPPPPPYVPTSVTMRQARLQLNVLGLYQAVNNAVSGMGQEAQIEWEYATSVDRGNPLTAAMVQLLGWTESETDDYFTAASQF